MPDTTCNTGVHFGAGNIGRGFIAQIFHKSGFKIVFVDVIPDLIKKLQATHKYTVTEIGSGGHEDYTIDNYDAINSKDDAKKVTHQIATSKIVTCAVGVRILEFIAPAIAEGIKARTKTSGPVAVIACENAIGGTDQLKEHIKCYLKKQYPDQDLDTIMSKAQFANSAIDRIVPDQDPNAGLNVKIEKYFEWCVESKPFDGFLPSLKGIHYVDDLTPYIERKLYTVNTSHATAAYFGYMSKVKFVHEAMQDETIYEAVQNVLNETAMFITKTHEISPEKQAEYVKQIISRISNPEFKDKVERVGRQPLRKLGSNERLIGPATGLTKLNMSCDALLSAVEMALHFQNVRTDPENPESELDTESVELHNILKKQEARVATKTITGLDDSNSLFKKVMEIVEKVKGDMTKS